MQVNLSNKKKKNPLSIEEKVKKINPDVYGPVQKPSQQGENANVYTEGAKKLESNPSNTAVVQNTMQTENSNSYEAVPVSKEGRTDIYGNDAYNQYNKKVEDGYKAYSNLVNSQVAGATSDLARNRRSIENSYNEAYKSLVKDKENNINKLPEAMAKLGLYGSGAGETAVANITSEYGNQLKSLMKAKNDALYDLDGQIEKVKQKGAEQIASYYSNMMQAQPDAFLAFLDKQFTERGYNDGRRDIERTQGIEDANISAQYGNFNPYAEQGYITPERAEELKNIIASSEEDSVYNSKLNKALTSAQYGNFQGLVDMGVITQERATELKNVLSNSEADSEYNSKLNKALTSAQYGNFQPLVELEIISPERAAELTENINASEEYQRFEMDNSKASVASGLGNYNPYADMGMITSEHAGILNQNWLKGLYQSKNTGTKGGSSGNSNNKETLKNLVESDISHWLYSTKGMNLETGDVTDDYFYKGWNENTNPVYAARDKLKDTNAVRFIKDRLLEAGYTSAQVNNLIEQYKETNEKEIAYAEGKTK